jgi:hypothetical protein
MSNENIKSRITNFSNYSVRFTNRIASTATVINSIISKQGKTEENLNLIRQFHLMKIDEFELLLFMFNEVSSDPDFERLENDELREQVTSTKSVIAECISQAKEELKNLQSVKKFTKKSKNKLDKLTSTRAIMKSFGLR